jgi:NAD(P)-dependent dehydrogenase (short-subunit alcohol dehydrogenase family)
MKDLFSLKGKNVVVIGGAGGIGRGGAGIRTVWRQTAIADIDAASLETAGEELKQRPVGRLERTQLTRGRDQRPGASG